MSAIPIHIHIQAYTYTSLTLKSKKKKDKSAEQCITCKNNLVLVNFSVHQLCIDQAFFITKRSRSFNTKRFGTKTKTNILTNKK